MKVAVVGAGIAGLMAARAIATAGHTVVVFERSRSPGGRLATRRIGSAQLDHGAQFFTVRSEAFAAHVEQWRRDGVVFEWSRGFGREPDGHPRYAVHGGMNSLAKHLAAGVDVRCHALVFSIHGAAGADARWDVKLDDGTITPVDALVITCPLPQAYSLLVSAEVAVPDLLWRTDYDRTLALLAVLDRPSTVPPPGGVQPGPPLQFVADNRAKGISDVPALTVHADPVWSRTHWDDDNPTALEALLDLARPYCGEARVVESQLKRWRFATPRSIWPEPCWSPADATAPVILAGDAFAGPKIEGAASSGLAAAARLSDL